MATINPMRDARPQVLLLAALPDTADAWASTLAVLTDTLWRHWDEVPTGAIVDVVITDLAGDHAQALAAHGQPQCLAIGDAPGPVAHFVLSPDAGPRELLQACQLLTRIARLQRDRDHYARLQAESRQLAETDPLTGLSNRRAWEAQLSAAAQLAHLGQSTIWLAILDLDHFKDVNEQLGYAVGDQVLAAAAHALRGELRHDDVVARLGGDEFGLILTGISETQARAIFERLRSALAVQSHLVGLQLPTASVGYARLDVSPARPDEALAAAERALRLAKRTGGNRVVAGYQGV